MTIRVRTRYDEVDRIPDLPDRPRFRTPWRVEPTERVERMHEIFGPHAAVIHAGRMDEAGQIYYLYTNGDVRRL